MQRLEHIVLNQQAMSYFSTLWGVPRANAAFGIDLMNDTSVLVRASRYEPTLVYLSNDLFASTDGDMSLGYDFDFQPGGIIAAPSEHYWTFYVYNSGPSDMRNGNIDIDVNVAANFVNVSNETSYNIHDCSKTSPTAASTRFSCPFDNGT